MKQPISLTIDAPLYAQLEQHLFPGDRDEHGAVIAAGIAETGRGTRLLARGLFLARDGIDYVPGTRGYRALTPRFVAETVEHCARENLCYLAVHNHGGGDQVRFSLQDLASHRRGYPALLDITYGGPVGALVLTPAAAAGDIWTPDGRRSLSHLRVVGPRARTLYPAPPRRPDHADPMYDRHARLFGDVGQAILGGLKVGIIGLGGGGSLVNEWLARLGIGHIVAIDFDRVELSNLPRIVGATRRDAAVGRYKVDVARRVARQANPRIRFDAVVGDILDEPTARRLTDVDFLMLASDTIQSRLVFNALVHQYLIPGVQIGAKVRTDRTTRQVTEIHTATRPVLPAAGHGCLECHDLIPAARLSEEALSEGERRAQRYVEDETVAEPSVIALNVLSAGQAVADLMLMFTGLYEGIEALPHQLHFVRERALNEVTPHANPTCLDCSTHSRSRRARGDRMRLPCRAPSSN
ncbi:MAG: ThiF family adenylyltransferase [Dehalococcoidia bacterium]